MVVGTTAESVAKVVRLTASAQFDASFGTDGVVTLGQVGIDRSGLLLGVGEDGEVDPLVELAVEDHQVKGGGLGSGPEVEDVIGAG